MTEGDPRSRFGNARLGINRISEGISARIPDQFEQIVPLLKDLNSFTQPYLSEAVQVISQSTTPERRKFLGRRLEAKFPIEISQDRGSSEITALQEFDRLLRKKVGVIVIYNHFSLTDPMRVLEALSKESEMFAKVPVVSPIAVHQRRKSVDALTALANIGRYPLVTKNTPEDLRKVNDKRELFMNYVNAAGTCLSEGGIVLLAPQQERKEFIDTKDVEENPVGILVKALRRKDPSKQAALMPIGLMLGDELHNNNSYFDLKEKNKGISMQIKFGIPEIINEEMQNVDEHGIGRLIDLTSDLADLHNRGVNPFVASEVENYIFSSTSS